MLAHLEPGLGEMGREWRAVREVRRLHLHRPGGGPCALDPQAAFDDRGQPDFPVGWGQPFERQAEVIAPGLGMRAVEGGQPRPRGVEARAVDDALDERVGQFEPGAPQILAPVRVQQQIGAGSQRGEAALGRGAPVRGALHLERVRDAQAGESEPLAQQGGEHGGGEGGGDAVVERGVDDMRAHDAVGLTQLAERRQLPGLERGEVGAAAGERPVRIELGVAVAGEVLETRGDSPAPEAGEHIPQRLRHGARRAAVGARADHRIGRFAVHIGDGCEIPVESECAQATRGPLGEEREVSGRRATREQCGIGGHGEMAGQLRHPAALLVEGDEEAARPRQRAQVLREPAQIVEVAEVAREHDHPGRRVHREILLPAGVQPPGRQPDDEPTCDAALSVHERAKVRERPERVNGGRPSAHPPRRCECVMGDGLPDR